MNHTITRCLSLGVDERSSCAIWKCSCCNLVFQQGINPFDTVYCQGIPSSYNDEQKSQEGKE